MCPHCKEELSVENRALLAPDERQGLLREALDALPWLDVTLEDGTGGQMVDRHAMLDIVDSALAAQVPAQEERLTIVCPACDGKREVMTGYYEPEPDKCWTCDGKGSLTGRALTPDPQDDPA